MKLKPKEMEQWSRESYMEALLTPREVEMMSHILFLEQQLAAERHAHEETKKAWDADRVDWQNDLAILFVVGTRIAELERENNELKAQVVELAKKSGRAMVVTMEGEIGKMCDMWEKVATQKAKRVAELQALLEACPKFYGWREFPHDVPYTEGNEENKKQFDEWNAAVEAAGVKR